MNSTARALRKSISVWSSRSESGSTASSRRPRLFARPATWKPSKSDYLRAFPQSARKASRPLSVSGCFSGTLGFLCTELQAGVELGAAIDKAGALGFTEPDPREDLSGRDVARKALIIARAMGRKMDPSEIELQHLNLRSSNTPLVGEILQKVERLGHLSADTAISQLSMDDLARLVPPGASKNSLYKYEAITKIFMGPEIKNLNKQNLHKNLKVIKENQIDTKIQNTG